MQSQGPTDGETLAGGVAVVRGAAARRDATGVGRERARAPCACRTSSPVPVVRVSIVARAPRRRRARLARPRATGCMPAWDRTPEHSFGGFCGVCIFVGLLASDG
eukprot:5621171-Prymnesium_polylepis.2